MSRTNRNIPQEFFMFHGLRIENDEVDHKARTIKGSKELYGSVFLDWWNYPVKWEQDYSQRSYRL